MSLIPKNWKVPEAFRQRLGEDVGRQRAMEAEGHLLVVLHEPPRPDQDERIGRVFWRDPSGAWTPKGLKHDELAIGELLGEYEKLIDQIDADEDVAQSSDQYFDVLTRLTPLVRAMHHVHAALQTAREKTPDDRRLISLRDRAYNLARRTELLQTDARNTLDFAIARRAEEQAASSRRMETASHRLNVLAAFFFPIATLTAIFGMNLNHGLEQLDTTHAPWTMVGVLAAGLVLGALLMGFITRR